MMLRPLVLATAVALATSASVSFGFGLPTVPKAPAAADNGSVSADAVDQFIVTGAASSALINDARVLLAAALSTKEERAQLMSQREQLKKGLDAKDKKAQDELKASNQSLDAKLAATTADEKAMESLKSLSAEQKKAVANSAINLAYGILLQKEQVAAGQAMISQIGANPRLASKLPAIKDTVTTMTTNLSGTAGYVVNFPKLFAALGVSPKMPASKDDKPAEAPASVEELFAER